MVKTRSMAYWTFRFQNRIVTSSLLLASAYPWGLERHPVGRGVVVRDCPSDPEVRANGHISQPD